MKEGWSAAEEAPCPGLSPGGFYEVSGGEDSAEFYQALTGETFTREGAWPEGLRTCREIPEPTDIEELQ